MPSLSVSVDGQRLATVSLEDGYDILAIHVSGSRIRAAFATLEFGGGFFPEDGDSVHRTWISQRPLCAGQVITVSMREDGQTSHPGKTFEEMFPRVDKTLFDRENFPPIEAVWATLKTWPKVWEPYCFMLAASDSASLSGQTLPEEESLRFSAVWDKRRPERARISLYSSTLGEDDLHYRVRQELHLGKSLHLRLDTLVLP
ncbi:hypothetical protein LMG10661_02154 [Ralstonia syzygii subsp. syzygii]|nr:hypothetical protein LMG10661_02154 [Ralstonia syzygii subsp. syzygii]